MTAPSDPKALVERLLKHGYAPGDYMATCISCGDRSFNVDKRANRCERCALRREVSSLTTRLAEVEREIKSVDEAEIRRVSDAWLMEDQYKRQRIVRADADSAVMALLHRAEASERDLAAAREAGNLIQSLVMLYFAPWGAAKAAQWEALTGDIPFTPEAALEFIAAKLAALSPATKEGNDG